MKERVRDFKPRDTRSETVGSDRRKQRTESWTAREFEALFSVRDQTTPTPELPDAKGQNHTDQAMGKADEKGFER